MTENTIARIVSLYGLKPLHIYQPQKGYRNQSWRVETSNGDINIMLYKQEPGIAARIRNADKVASHLHTHDLPVRIPLDNRILRIALGDRERFARAYNYLPGHTIPWDAYTMDHLKLLGKTMSDMHAGLQSYEATELAVESNVADEYLAILTRMERYFGDKDVVNALQQKLELSVSPVIFPEFRRTLRYCKQLPHQQALHMDFVRSNILFADTASGVTISGIIDFEKAAYGHPVFDIARTLAFLLVDCKYKSPEQIRKYFLWSGYHKRGTLAYQPLLVDNDNVLNRLIRLFLCYDFYKFLRHNPYDSLSQNEHFTSTIRVLKAYELLI